MGYGDQTDQPVAADLRPEAPGTKLSDGEQRQASAHIDRTPTRGPAGDCRDDCLSSAW